MNIAPYEAGGGNWAWYPTEHRLTDLRDAAGKRIGYEIERSLNLNPSDKTPHWRWVSVTKDGEWLRNEWTTSYATWEEAEKWVEARIRRSIARYEKLANKRGVATANVRSTVESTSTSPVAFDARNAPRRYRSRKSQGCLVVIAIAAAVLMASVGCLASAL